MSTPVESNQAEYPHEIHANCDPSPIKQVDELNTQARTLRAVDLIQSARMSEDALSLARNCDPPYELGIAQAHYNLAYVIQKQGNNGEAIPEALASLERYQQLEDAPGAFDCNHLLGHLYLNIDDYSSALSHLMDALELADKIKLPRNKARTYNSIAIVQSHTGEHAQAIESNQQAITIFREENELYGLAAALNSCCIDYRLLGQFEDALRYGEESYLCICQVEDSSYWQATSLSTIGEVYWAKGEYRSALEKFESSLELFAQTTPNYNATEAIETLYNKANCLSALGKEAESLEIFTQTLTLAVQYQSKRITSYCHRELAKIYESRQQFDKAYAHFYSFHQFDKQVFDEDRAQQVTKLKALYRFQQAQAEVEHQKALREQDQLHYEQITALTSKFIRNLTHDLKNPLSTILLLLANLETRLGHGAQASYGDIFEKMRRNLYRMNHLIVDLLDLTKMESEGKSKLTSVDIQELIHNVEDNLSTSAKERHITLAFHSQFINPIVYIDPEQITRALENLITNAIKYTTLGGRVTVETKQSEDMLIVEVSDTGVGIATEDLPNIFLPFYRARSHHIAGIEGTGLGLAIVESIIKNHGGILSVNSELNLGSTFRFCIPWQKNEEDNLTNNRI